MPPAPPTERSGDQDPTVSTPQEELIFDGSSFESANLASARLVNDNPMEYDLHIRPDTLNERHRVWFYFSVRGARAGQKVVFNIVGYSKTKSLFREGMAPVVCSSGRPYWERMPPTSVYYYRSPRHDKAYVLSFPFCFERADETYYFAYCWPYTYSYLQRFLFALEGKGLPFFQRECLCRSIQERRLDMLTVSSPANLRIDAALRAGEPLPALPPDGSGAPARRHVVFLTSRVHPGESPASFIMHGLILFLTSEHPRARELRETAILKVVPMLNPDGVFLGNYRCNSVGLDLNRLWHTTAAVTAPTIHAVREEAQLYTHHPLCSLEMIVDMHAHSTCMNGFIFANTPDDPRDLDAVAAFPRTLSTHARDFSMAGCKFDTDPNKAGTGRRALSELLPGVHCYTLEVSMFCAAQGNARGEPYLPATYTEMGHNLGLALHEHFCLPRTPPSVPNAPGATKPREGAHSVASRSAKPATTLAKSPSAGPSAGAPSGGSPCSGSTTVLLSAASAAAAAMHSEAHLLPPNGSAHPVFRATNASAAVNSTQRWGSDVSGLAMARAIRSAAARTAANGRGSAAGGKKSATSAHLGAPQWSRRIVGTPGLHNAPQPTLLPAPTGSVLERAQQRHSATRPRE